MKARALWVASTWALIVLGSSGILRAEESLETLMPEDVIGYARGMDLAARLDEFLRSDLRKDLEGMETVRYLLSQKPWKRFEKGLDDFKDATGQDAIDVFKKLFGKEIIGGVRFQLSGPEVIVLSRTASEKDAGEVLASLRAGVEKKIGRALGTEESMHLDRKIETFEGGKLSMGRLGSVLVLSNLKSGVESVIDLAEKRTKGSIRESSTFRKGGSSGDALLSIAVRPRFVPGFHVPDKFPEALPSLLFGGIVGAVGDSDLLTASLRLADGGIVIDSAAHPADTKDGSLDLKPFFPPPTSDALIRRLLKRGILSSLTIRRNLSQWWEAREDLLTPRAAGQLLEFAQGISNFFGGRSFQDEILPEFGPTITPLARNQSYSDLKEKPRPAIPAFAILFELKNAGQFGNSFVAAFQAIVTLINLGQAEKNKGQDMAMMLTRTEKFQGNDLHTVSLSYDKTAKPGLSHNFTPSLAVVGTTVVLSSSAELAKVVLEEMAQVAAPGSIAPETSDKDGRPSSDSLVIDAEAARAALADNLDIIVADNMMKKGQSKEEAEREMKQVLEAVGRLRDLKVETRRDADAVRLTLRLRLLSGKEQPAAPGKSADKTGVRL